jgi:uncharacterized LabA/DUF88 family protein
MAAIAPKTMIFADGENLVMRYQEMVSHGKKPKKTVVHVQDSFVWSPEITTWSCFNIVRASYYTSITGDENLIQKAKDDIADVLYEFSYDPDPSVPAGSAQIVPFVFKKDKKSQKTRNVDINIIIDTMRHSLSLDLEIIYILSGDGDYLPLIQEIMRHGKTVYLSAFTSGLHPRLRSTVDVFNPLDDLFFIR